MPTSFTRRLLLFREVFLSVGSSPAAKPTFLTRRLLLFGEVFLSVGNSLAAKPTSLTCIRQRERRQPRRISISVSLWQCSCGGMRSKHSNLTVPCSFSRFRN